MIIIPVICLMHVEDDQTLEIKVWWLMLQAQSGFERGIYRRVGTATLSLDSTEYGTASVDSALHMIWDLQKPLEDHCFEDRFPDGIHSIIVEWSN